MSTHPYLRAYMAGITIPTILLLFVMTLFVVARHVYDVSVPIERFVVFPMAIVPNLWGLWNMLYVSLHPHRHLPIGFHGAALSIVQVLLAFGLTRLLDFEIPTVVATAFPLGLPIVVAVFYLVWKHLVSFFNTVLGIAG
jgi:hypothetical protein